MKIEIEEMANNSCCIGCGACEVALPDVCKVYLNNTYSVQLGPGCEEYKEKLYNICPVTNNEYVTSKMWGEIKEAYYAYSLDNSIRTMASSGGMITSICCYLLENKIVDGVIQCRASVNNPIENSVVVSRTIQDVLKCCGSRYSPVSMLKGIKQILSGGGKFAFVGKPCDVRALKNLTLCQEIDSDQIVLTLSFFCAGTPSLNATKEVIDEMGVKLEDVMSFSYRGNGWPGYATAKCNNGLEYKMSYNDSWGKILGRQLHNACRFCVDGVGVSADIACGDAWYCDSKGYPIFEEAEGRNILLVRSDKGSDVIKQMAQTRKQNIFIENVEGVEDVLKKIQPYQYNRKALMNTKLLVLRLCGKYTPKFGKALKEWDKQISITEKIKYAKGTIQRIIKKKIK